jgi:hypothetical protein
MEKQEQYYQAKKRLNELFPNRNNSPEERNEFDDLLIEITDYELKTGMINEKDIK